MMCLKSSLKEFTFRELEVATENFNPDMLLGEGSFGRVYKGWIREDTLSPSTAGVGIAVAVKILNPDSHHGFDEWQNEVNVLGRHYHPNIIGLVGYCWEGEKLGLVYEYMHKRSLADQLFRKDANANANAMPLSWDLRLKIAIGAARGLAFLHSLKKKIICRDFKSSNIMLDENYNAKLSDFGLAMWGPSSEDSAISTIVMGTYGYADPEYVATGNVYLKSDVYGFGVVLLELLTGLRTVDMNRSSGKRNLVDWLSPMLSRKKRVGMIMDAQMKGQYSTEAAFQVAKLILNCLQPLAQARLSIREVVEKLKEIAALEN